LRCRNEKGDALEKTRPSHVRLPVLGGAKSPKKREELGTLPEKTKKARPFKFPEEYPHLEVIEKALKGTYRQTPFP